MKSVVQREGLLEVENPRGVVQVIDASNPPKEASYPVTRHKDNDGKLERLQHLELHLEVCLERLPPRHEPPRPRDEASQRAGPPKPELPRDRAVTRGLVARKRDGRHIVERAGHHLGREDDGEVMLGYVPERVAPLRVLVTLIALGLRHVFRIALGRDHGIELHDHVAHQQGVGNDVDHKEVAVQGGGLERQTKGEGPMLIDEGNDHESHPPLDHAVCRRQDRYRETPPPLLLLGKLPVHPPPPLRAPHRWVVLAFKPPLFREQDWLRARPPELRRRPARAQESACDGEAAPYPSHKAWLVLLAQVRWLLLAVGPLGQDRAWRRCRHEGKHRRGAALVSVLSLQLRVVRPARHVGGETGVDFVGRVTRDAGGGRRPIGSLAL
mmetsp:Transcript_32981/g.84525  ORF Transcript_32981/g.84525 Transcript_32981/m.84525 type:complete len:382 (-) Transcript_32981:334-1479(-)